ncbi:MAG TPA: hypothetical protein VME46_18180, partial [Acidimicrobiales bacterium]|nr:hypothetical protein [Acidimicrobiales bacterium]
VLRNHADSLVLAECHVSAVPGEVTLLVSGRAALAADLGPELDADLTIKPKALVAALVGALLLTVPVGGIGGGTAAEQEAFARAAEITADDAASAEGGAVVVAGDQLGANLEVPAEALGNNVAGLVDSALTAPADTAAYDAFLAGWQQTVAEGADLIASGEDGAVVSGADAGDVDAAAGDSVGGFWGWVLDLCEALCEAAA